MIRKQAGFTTLVALAFLTSGCLQKDTTHTLCLSPDGAVTWIASENNVYSDITDPAKRKSEEQEYIAAAAAGRHGVALALEAMGPLGPVRTRVLRDEAPFFVVTDARFHSIERVMQRLLDDAPGDVSVSLSADGTRWTLKMAFDFGTETPEHETAVSAIINDMEHLRIVMTSGHFVSATGFDLVNGTVATLSEDWMKQAEKVYEAKGTVEMILTWEAGPV